MTEAEHDQSAEALFRALGALVRRGEIALRLDFARLDHMDSPVAVQAEGNRWAYAIIAAALLALWRAGGLAALGVAVAGFLAYYVLGRRRLHRRLEQRVMEGALTSLALWRALWRWGGVALVAPGGKTCAAPAGNWMALVRDLREPANARAVS